MVRTPLVLYPPPQSPTPPPPLVYCPGLPVNCDPMAPVLYTGWMHAGKLTFVINPAGCLSFEVFIIHMPLWVFSKPGGGGWCVGVRQHSRPFPIMPPPLTLPQQFIFNSTPPPKEKKQLISTRFPP